MAVSIFMLGHFHVIMIIDALLRTHGLQSGVKNTIKLYCLKKKTKLISINTTPTLQYLPVSRPDQVSHVLLLIPEIKTHILLQKKKNNNICFIHKRAKQTLDWMFDINTSQTPITNGSSPVSHYFLSLQTRLVLLYHHEVLQIPASPDDAAFRDVPRWNVAQPDKAFNSIARKSYPVAFSSRLPRLTRVSFRSCKSRRASGARCPY